MSDPLRIMHFADTHFGVENYGKLDIATGIHSRLLDFRRSLGRAVELALQAGIDYALFAGDAFHLQAPRPTEQREFADALRPLLEAGVPIVLVTGNHDMPTARGRAASVDIYRALRVPGVTVADAPAVYTLQCPRGPLKVAALPYMSSSLAHADDVGTIRQRQHAAAALYRKALGNLAVEVGDPKECPVVLVGHLLVEGATLSPWQHGSSTHYLEPTLTVNELQQGPWDYVALGHLHRYQVLSLGSAPPVVYCGSVDRIDIAEAGESRGFVLAEVSRGRAIHRFVDVDVCRPMCQLEIKAVGDNPTKAVLDELVTRDWNGVIVRLILACEHGRRGVVDEARVRSALASAQDISIVYQSLTPETTTDMVTIKPSDVRAQLESYLSRPDLRSRKQVLLQTAEPLLQQVMAEPDEKEMTQ